MARHPISLAVPFLLVASHAFGQGGPPLITDDPGTPGDGKVELNLGLMFEQTHKDRTVEAPLFDFNYGLGEHVQLKYEAAFLILDKEHAGPVGGLSNSLVGAKWRFLDEDRHGLAMSVYPQVEFNNPRFLRRDFIESGTHVLLPVEVARTFGPWEVGAEVGYQFVQYADDQWIYGVAVGYPLTKQVELLGEIHGTVDQDFHRNDVLFNLGTRWKLGDEFTLLFAAGRSFRHADESPNLLVYAALQWSF
jgi:hypothetical protein